jgi:hypothetical protein
MISLESYKNSKEIKGLVEKLFESRQVAHTIHLKTKSYAIHKALNHFYDDITDLTDTLVETYQGQYGLVTDYKIDIPNINPDEIIVYLEEAAEIFKIGHNSFDEKDTHLHNILDEIVGLTYQTLYKLKFLK